MLLPTLETSTTANVPDAGYVTPTVGSFTVPADLSNSLLLVFFNCSGSSYQLRLDSSSGDILTELGTAFGSGTRQVLVYYLKNPSAGSHSIWVNNTATGYPIGVMNISVWSDVDQTTPVQDVGSALGSTGFDSASIPESRLVFAIGSQWNDSEVGATTGYTEIQDAAVENAFRIMAAYLTAASTGREPISWTPTASRNARVVCVNGTAETIAGVVLV